ncbi:MAG: CARDB domain-containing protein [Myxococcota bacterium]
MGGPSRPIALVAAAALVVVGACDGDSGDSAPDADAAGGETGAVDVARGGAAPHIEASIVASTTSGNAPLDVDFSAEVTGEVERCADLGYRWNVDGATVEEEAFTHTFYVSTTTTVTLDVTCRTAGGSVGTASSEQYVQVRGCADLGFEQVSLLPPVEVAPGDEVLFKQGEIWNAGDRIAEPFEVHVVLSENDLYEPEEDRVVDVRTFEGMDAGLFEDVSIDLADTGFQVPEDMEEGNYFVFLVADPGEVINECQETNNRVRSTNNLTVEAGAGLKPDLLVEDVSFVEGLTVHQGQNINYSFTVRNVGAGDAEQFRVASWLSEDDQLDPESDRVMSGPDDLGATVSQMAVNAKQPYFKNFEVPEDLPDGDYWVIVMADAKDEEEEEDEDNNVAVSPYPLTMEFEEQTCFDLELVDLQITPTSTYWDGTVQVLATVRNPGTEAAPAGAIVRAQFSQLQSLNPQTGTVVGEWTLPGIAAGEEIVVDEIIEVGSDFPVKPHWVGVLIDPDDDLDECTEANNAELFGEPVTIASTASVDLGVVSEVEFHPGTVTAGEGIKVTHTIENSGSSAASAFRVAVVLGEGDDFGMSDVQAGEVVEIYSKVVPTLEAGAEVERVEDVVVPVALDHAVSTYHVGVVLDPEGSQGTDSHKGNNVEVSESPLTVLEPQGGCFEDDLEPNDTKGEASPLEPGEYDGLGSCGDDDWFSIHVPEGDSLLVDVRAEPILSLGEVSSDLDVELYAPDGSLADTSVRSGSSESVQAFVVADAGEWLVRVHPKAPDARAAYDLSARVRAPVEGVDLLPADVSALPTPLYPGGLLNVAWNSVNLGAAEAGQHTATVWASRDETLDPADDIALETIEIDAAPALDLQARDVDVLLPSDLGGGTWRFLVQVDAGDEVGDVDPGNNVAPSDTVLLDDSIACQDDDLEPNNAADIATPLDLSDGDAHLSDMTVCPQLEDWYAVELEEGEAFTAMAAYTHDEDRGLVAVELWDPTASAVLLEDTGEGTSKVLLPWVWTGGTYYVRVVNEAQEGVVAPYQYDLTATRGPGDPGSACEADAFEPADAFANAAPIGCGLQEATLCRGDADVYRLEMSAEQTVTITLDHPDGDLAMGLYTDPDASAVETEEGNGQVSWTAPEDQTVWLRVRADGGPMDLEAFDYTLFMDGVPGVDLVVPETSLLLGEVYQGEDDRVDFAVENTCVDDSGPFSVAFWLSKDDALDEADVPLSSSDLPGVVGKSILEVSQKVFVPYSTEPGDYHVLVEADDLGEVEESNEDNNTAGAPITVARLCLPDAFEPNDLLMDEAPWAPLLEAPGAEGLALCPFELDWYAVEVPAGASVTVGAVFDQEEGDLDLRLYDPAYSKSLPVVVSATGQGHEVATYQPPAGGVVLVRVNGFDGASAAYDLEVTLE